MDVQKKPSPAFVGASWLALFLGALGFSIGLWNATMPLSSKGLLFTLLMYGLFSAVSVQKAVRDRLEGIPVTNIYYGLSWISVMLCLLLTAVALWNAGISLAEKGFYSIANLLSLFAAITVQKNTRDSTGTGVDRMGVLAQQDLTHRSRTKISAQRDSLKGASTQCRGTLQFA